MRILIVEDEITLARVLQEKFEKEGFQVQVIKDGESVMGALKKDKPDIVLLDLILPKKHGLDVLKELKADSELAEIPVLVLSNLDSDEDIKNALSLGAVDYFVKAQHPIKEIVEKVNNYLVSSK